ncbi:class I SAM-dependent methyltransferase [Actinomadura madurae]|uniref:class I SAM-dependent methyltransferase n=1 Tax=Actinomadura madurae TaxID=1993 RepID=UPI00202622A6|nr:class I SAM-dependent methyltransferase [Actinomadura madurae]URN01867.1 class I SAM-dependent methyltransferase [Actinomadura madurae]URN10523.1 class I SAM-dependent methyltransferase [Actinomadura madurae]
MRARAHRAGLAALGEAPLDGVPRYVRDLDLAVLKGIAAFLGTALPPDAPRTAGQVADVLETASRHRWIPGHWLAALTGESLVKREPGARYLGPRRFRRSELAEVRETLDRARGGLGYPEALTRYLLDSLRLLPGLLRDEVSAQSLLFPRGEFGIAAAAYRDNLANAYLNAAAVKVVHELEVKGRVLELGAGTGSLTTDLLPALDGHVTEYLFTDLSPFFLDAARTRFAGHPFLRPRVVDFDRDLAAQCGPDPFDLVVAVNAAHNASHTGTLLGRVRESLAPGGALLLVETCHEHHQSLASMPFLLSARPGGSRPERRDGRAGTGRTYLTRREWLAALRTAGLAPLLDLPHPDHPLAAFSQHLLVAAREP